MAEPVSMSQAKGEYAHNLWPVTNKDLVFRALERPSFGLAVSSTVGFPLQLTSIAHSDVDAPNDYNKNLGLDPDPTSLYFDKSSWPLAPTGAAIVFRCDLTKPPISQIHVPVKLYKEVCKEAEDLTKKEAKGDKLNSTAL